ncbi:MAG: hypothetical protein PHU01_14775, partial [Desulfuromonadaceae bacterium]|nr:hypothetical protein [Desulfuromonadaceae bacterium]
MINWLKNRIFLYLGTKLDGKKTYLAGCGFILLALAGCVGKLFPDQGLPDMEWDLIGGYFTAGLGAFGLGHKG